MSGSNPKRPRAARLFAGVAKWVRGVGANDSGEALVGFAILLPILVLVCVAILEFSLVVFDYHRAGEATRRAARIASINTSLIVPANLTAGGTISCSSSLGAITCSGVAATPVVFDDLIAKMQEILPAIMPENVQVDYSDIGLGDATTPGGIIPLVTVRLVNLQHPFLMLGGFPGFGTSFTYPPFTTNQIAGGMG